MPAKRITDAFCRNVRPPRKNDRPNQVAYIDTMERGLALVLVVSYGGSKTFQGMRYVNGKPKVKKLGKYPQMTVKEARRAARDYWENPEKFEAASSTGTFKGVAEEWFKRHVERSGLIEKPEIRRRLERYVHPRWQDRPFLEIRRGEVNRLLDEVEDDHGPAQADACLADIRRIMSWYESRDENYVSPIVSAMKRYKPAPRARWLSDDEIRVVWEAAGDCGAFGAILKLALLTAQRRSKIATMKWSDVDLETGVWTIPREAREKGTPERIKLPRMALDIVAAQERVAGNPHVFPGSERGRRRAAPDARSEPPAFNSFSERQAELNEKLPPDMPRWTPHDLRRTARALMSRAGTRPDVAELALGHSLTGIQAVYDRPHEYQPLIDRALDCVAQEVARIVESSGGKVVLMRQR